MVKILLFIWLHLYLHYILFASIISPKCFQVEVLDWLSGDNWGFKWAPNKSFCLIYYADPISSCPLSLAVKAADGKTNSYVDSAHLVEWNPPGLYQDDCVSMEPIRD